MNQKKAGAEAPASGEKATEQEPAAFHRLRQL